MPMEIKACHPGTQVQGDGSERYGEIERVEKVDKPAKAHEVFVLWSGEEEAVPVDPFFLSPLRCITPSNECAGPVQWHTTPDRTDGKAFPRCEFHFDKRMESVQRTLELTSPARPSWFDESFAGERWDED